MEQPSQHPSSFKLIHCVIAYTTSFPQMKKLVNTEKMLEDALGQDAVLKVGGRVNLSPLKL